MHQSGRKVADTGETPMRQGLEEHLSPESLAEQLKCSVATIRRAVWRRELDAVRVGRLVRIPTSAAHRWLESSRLPRVPE